MILYDYIRSSELSGVVKKKEKLIATALYPDKLHWYKNRVQRRSRSSFHSLMD